MKLLTLFLFLSSLLCYSQKEYKFNHIIEYDYTIYKGDSLATKTYHKKRYYLTNSNNNTFIAVVTELDSLNYKIDFKEENGNQANFNLLKTDLHKSEFIHIDCKYVNAFISNNSKTEDYAFFNLSDTIVNTTNYKRYKLTSNNAKQERRKQLATQYFIILPETQYHLPIFYNPLEYLIWKNNSNIIPNGIFKEKYVKKYNSNLHSTEKLIQHSNIDKKIVIDSKCNYSKNK